MDAFPSLSGNMQRRVLSCFVVRPFRRNLSFPLLNKPLLLLTRSQRGSPSPILVRLFVLTVCQFYTYIHPNLTLICHLFCHVFCYRYNSMPRCLCSRYVLIIDIDVLATTASPSIQITRLWILQIIKSYRLVHWVPHMLGVSDVVTWDIKYFFISKSTGIGG